MHFSSQINRPPYEAMSGYLQVTSGCSHNECAFCTFYKDARFKVSPLREVEADLQEMADSGIPYQRLFLQGADPFILSHGKLMNLVEMINKYLPSVKTINSLLSR